MNLSLAHDALKKYYGYDSFRPMQADIVESIYAKKDALVLMPTGGGKSICFQIPAITTEGVCVVVSPLISLMKDQVEALRANGITAAFLNSSLSPAEQEVVRDDIYNENLNLVYVSPETLLTQSFMQLLQVAKINLFAIDEAHCISSWGHDFRKEYKELALLKKQFPKVPVVALTATADKITRRDIIEQLGLQDPEIFISSFDRPNISLEVRPGQNRIEQIVDFIQKHPGQPGIIYCLSRKNTEQVARKLHMKGIIADFYHAGLPSDQRSKVQEDFLNDNTQVVCATIAFGMGIDKSNVRWVIHYSLPKNLEGYYQEIGRAGRDGVKAETILFYSFRDVIVLRDILTKNGAENEAIQLAKLDRMIEYADALICRRKILLNYFSENLSKDCGNCDVCKNPPRYFNGTVIAQKALSAIARMQERVGIRMLIDVLRGSKRKEIIQRGYDRIKTFGAGADISANDWQTLLRQMINLGLIEIAYDQGNVLKLTAGAKEVLFQNRQIQLVKMEEIRSKIQERKSKTKPKGQRQRVRDELFEILRQLRKKIAQQRGIPPYIIFSDATLEEMAAMKPKTDAEFLAISGVGEHKMRQYGAVFMGTIRSFILNKSNTGQSIKGSTYLETLQLYNRGFNPEQIAQERQLSTTTIEGHLVELYRNGEDIKIKRLLKKKDIELVVEALNIIPEPAGLKAVYEFCDEKLNYFKIKLAMAWIEKNG